jgi:tetratricopeptide (TPR) repeat protein
VSHSPQSTETRQGVDEYSNGWGAILDLARQGKSWSGRERNCAFLNRDGVSFANVSASSGLDFADDGRTVAVTDWDHDGDLDLWLRSRTGPRLRLMLNQTRSPEADRAATQEPAFVALRLVGVDCNRDAIGARVELQIGNKNLIQTLRAGDAYLSQSSKWLHFGLGTGAQMASLRVRWPNGQTETFAGVQSGGHYLLEQGSGKATAWKRSQAGHPLALDASVQPQAAPTKTAQAFLPVRVPTPILRYATFEGAQRQIESPQAPLLISLWASWCSPCVAELKAFTEHSDKIRSAGLQILALSVDGLDPEQATNPATAKSALDRLGFPFDWAMATRELVDKVDLMLQYLFDRHPPFAVPLSLLLDRQGHIAAVYRGPVEPERLLRDVANLDASPERLRQLAAPMAGLRHRSARRRTAPRLKSLAQHFEDRYQEDNMRFLQLAIQAESGPDTQGAQLTPAQETLHAHDSAETYYLLAKALHKENRLQEAVRHYRLAVEARPDYTDARGNLGAALAALGNRDEAIEQYRQTLRTNPDYAPAHYNLANALEAAGKLDDAVQHYERALQIDPYDARTHNNLALALRAQGKLSEAIERFQQALQVDQDQPLAHYNLGTCFKSQGQLGKAIYHYERALELDAENADTLNNLGQALLAHGDADAAIRRYRRALEIAPSLPRSHYNLAIALQSRGKLEAALPHFRQTVRLAPREPLVYTSLATVLTELGNVDEARTNYQLALQLAKDAGDQKQVQSIDAQLKKLLENSPSR